MATAKGPKRRPARKAPDKALEGALKLLHKKSYEKAQGAFEAILADNANEGPLAATARTYLRVCARYLSKGDAELDGGNALYENGVFHLNNRDYAQALELFEKALKDAGPESSHIHYALAALEALQKNTDESLKHLKKSIEIKDEQRFIASHDPDFASLASQKEFTELIDPEA